MVDEVASGVGELQGIADQLQKIADSTIEAAQGSGELANAQQDVAASAEEAAAAEERLAGMLSDEEYFAQEAAIYNEDLATAQDQVAASAEAEAEALAAAQAAKEAAAQATLDFEETTLAATEATQVFTQEALAPLVNMAPQMGEELIAASYSIDQTAQAFSDWYSGAISVDEAVSQVSGVAATVATNVAEVGATVEEATTAMVGMGDMARNLGEAVSAVPGLAVAAFQDLGSAINSAGMAFGNFINSMSEAGIQMTIMLGVVGLLVGMLLKAGSDAQLAFAHIQGLALGTTNSIQPLIDQVSKLAETYGVNLTDAANAAYYVISAHVGNMQQNMQILAAAMEAASASGADLTNVANSLTTAMTVFNIPATQVKQTMDEMVKTVIDSKTTFDIYSSYIGGLATTAHNAGISFQEMSASLGLTLSQAGPTEEMQRTFYQHLQSLMATFALGPEAMAEHAKKAGVSFDETAFKGMNLAEKLQYLAQISGGTNTLAFQDMVGGANQVQAALLLMENRGKNYQDVLKGIKDSHGAVDTAFHDSEQTMTKAWDHMTTSLQVFGLALVKALSPTLIPLLTNIANGFTYFSENISKMTPYIAGLAAAIGVLLVGALIGLIALLGPAGVLIAALTLAVGTATTLIVGFVQDALDKMDQQAQQKVTDAKKLLQQDQKNQKEDTSNVKSLESDRQKILDQIKNTNDPVEKAQLVHNLKMLDAYHQDAQNRVTSDKVAGQQHLAAVKKAEEEAAAEAKKTWQEKLGDMFKNANDEFGKEMANFIQFDPSGFDRMFSELGKHMQTGLANLKKTWQDFEATVASDWKYFLDNVVTPTKQKFDDLRNYIGAWFSNIGTVIQSKLKEEHDFWANALANFDHMLVVFFTQTIPNIAKEGMQGFGDLLVQGLEAIPGRLLGPLANIGNMIASHLHFSKPDVGPLANADTWMPDFTNMLAEGLTNGTGKLRNAAMGAAGIIASSVPSSSSLAGASFNRANDSGPQIVAVLNQILSALHTSGGGVTRNAIGVPTVNNNTATIQQYNNIADSNSAAALYLQLNYMMGLANEYAQRGATNGVGT